VRQGVKRPSRFDRGDEFIGFGAEAGGWALLAVETIPSSAAVANVRLRTARFLFANISTRSKS